MSNIRTELMTRAASFYALNGNPGAWMLETFIARNGTAFAGQPLPSRYKQATPKMCFENAQRLVRRSRGKLRYVEGFVSRLMLVHHGWAIDEKDRVIDPTLRDIDGDEYCGVVLTPEQIAAFQSPWSWSVFDTGRGMNLDMFRDLDPDLGELVDSTRQDVRANPTATPDLAAIPVRMRDFLGRMTKPVLDT